MTKDSNAWDKTTAKDSRRMRKTGQIFAVASAYDHQSTRCPVGRVVQTADAIFPSRPSHLSRQGKDYRIGTLSKVNNIIYCKNDVLAE